MGRVVKIHMHTFLLRVLVVTTAVVLFSACANPPPPVPVQGARKTPTSKPFIQLPFTASETPMPMITPTPEDTPIPSSTPGPSLIAYTVRSGDTLGAISIR